MEAISPPTITLAFADFEEIHPTNTHRRVFTASTSVDEARSVRMDRDSETLTPLFMTLSFVVYTPFGCIVTPTQLYGLLCKACCPYPERLELF